MVVNTRTVTTRSSGAQGALPAAGGRTRVLRCLRRLSRAARMPAGTRRSSQRYGMTADPAAACAATRLKIQLFNRWPSRQAPLPRFLKYADGSPEAVGSQVLQQDPPRTIRSSRPPSGGHRQLSEDIGHEKNTVLLASWRMRSKLGRPGRSGHARSLSCAQHMGRLHWALPP